MMPGEAVTYLLPNTEMQPSETATVTVARAEAPHVDAARWVDDHGDYLFRFALTRLRDDGLAEDAVQETLLAAMQSIGSYAGKSSERTWLTSILKNKIFDHYRKRSREVPIEGETAELSEVGKFFERDDMWNGHWNNKLQPHKWDMTPEEALQESEFIMVLENCMDKLPERAASVFTLREMDGLESSEICELLQLSSSNFWVLMHRARLALRRCIEVNWFRRAVKQ